MFLINVVFSLYFFMLVLFCMVNHPMYYCGLLVLNSFLCALISYLVFGFSWYSLLLCLMYVGGVYMLFMFVSVYSPKSSYMTWFSMSYSGYFILTFMVLLVSSMFLYCVMHIEFSSFLCSFSEGNFYIFMCLTLLFGFIMLSLVMCIKINYYR